MLCATGSSITAVVPSAAPAGLRERVGACARMRAPVFALALVLCVCVFGFERFAVSLASYIFSSLLCDAAQRCVCACVRVCVCACVRVCVCAC